MLIGEKIKELRKEKKMTLKDLADKSGLSTVSLTHYETGKITPNLLSIKKLSEALGCDFDTLYELR